MSRGLSLRVSALAVNLCTLTDSETPWARRRESGSNGSRAPLTAPQSLPRFCPLCRRGAARLTGRVSEPGPRLRGSQPRASARRTGAWSGWLCPAPVGDRRVTRDGVSRPVSQCPCFCRSHLSPPGQRRPLTGGGGTQSRGKYRIPGKPVLRSGPLRAAASRPPSGSTRL